MITLDSLFKKKKPVQYNPAVSKDCTRCTFQPDLGNNDCLRCICNEVRANNGCDRIMIEAGVQMELSDQCIPLINDISRSFCGHSFGMDTRRCTDCPLGHSLEDDLWDDFTEENIDTIIERVKVTYIDCNHCEECAHHAYDVFQQMKEDYRSLSKDALHLANRIVGA